MIPYAHCKQAALFEGANSDGLQGLRALIGAGLGGVLGAGLGAGGGLLKETFFTPADQAQYLRRALQGMSLGGLAGAGIGAGVGASNIGKGVQNALEDSAARANTKMLQYVVDALNAVEVKGLSPLVGTPTFGIKEKETTNE
jgi:hypothetical protein